MFLLVLSQVRLCEIKNNIDNDYLKRLLFNIILNGVNEFSIYLMKLKDQKISSLKNEHQII